VRSFLMTHLCPESPIIPIAILRRTTRRRVSDGVPTHATVLQINDLNKKVVYPHFHFAQISGLIS